MSMSFALSEDQLTLQRTIRRFVDHEIVPVRQHYDQTEEFPWPQVKKMQELGINCMIAPEKYSGAAFSYQDIC
ncbi:MAG: acyl-CoA dehydrogenase family protein, partial [Syntrophomonadaceae bacterium]|nr:acyl-CoA dehydrogenase family protein [Syntrophomonadaceae bacterium]